MGACASRGLERGRPWGWLPLSPRLAGFSESQAEGGLWARHGPRRSIVPTGKQDLRGREAARSGLFKEIHGCWVLCLEESLTWDALLQAWGGSQVSLPLVCPETESLRPALVPGLPRA